MKPNMKAEELRYSEVFEPVSTAADGRRRVFVPCNDQAYAVARPEGQVVTLTNLVNRGGFNINIVGLDQRLAGVEGTLVVLEPDEEVAALVFPDGVKLIVAICPSFGDKDNGVLEL